MDILHTLSAALVRSRNIYSLDQFSEHIGREFLHIGILTINGK